MSSTLWPLLGCGVGLRTQHYAFVTSEFPPMDWFEATTENFMDSGGRPLKILEKVRSRYPVALHGVSLSIGSADLLNAQYLERLKMLVDRIDPFIVSDHLCWSGVDSEQLHDLLPLPFTEEAIRHVVSRIQKVQEFIGRRILVENVSTYVTYKHSTMPEWKFLTETARRAGCGILLDLNNIYVNSKNHGFDPYEYLQNIPGALVAQFHLAGHTDMGTFLFDTHSAEVVNPVWDIYRKALELYGRVNTLIEWDEAVPEFSRLAQEREKARTIYLKYPVKKEILEFQAPKIPIKEVDPAILGAQRAIKSRIQPGAHAEKAQLEKLLNIAGEERILAYANGYHARMHEALSETYPTVKHLVGPEVFMELAQDYAAAYPSHDYNLNHAGKHFSEFLEKHSVSVKLGFLPDLVKLEWRISLAFHAFDETESSEEAPLASSVPEDWDKARILFRPSVSVLSSPWPVLDLWKARSVPLKEINIDLVDRPQSVLIFREGVEVRCQAIDGYQSKLLAELLQGRTLGEACEKLAQEMEEDEAPAVAQWFQHWAAKGLIRRLEFSKEIHEKMPFLR